MTALTRWLSKGRHIAQDETVAVLDVGSSKIVCLIARADDSGALRIVGIGHHLSEGVRCGGVSDMEALQRAVTSAVTTAEHMAGGDPIERVFLNVSGPRLSSQTVEVDLPLGGHEMTADDLDRIRAQGQTLLHEDSNGPTLDLIHTLPVQYTLDGQKGIRDPVGMIGEHLTAQLHLLSAPMGPVQTLVTTVARCHLEVERIVASPYASGLACLVEDEMDLGCTLIDIGGGTTSLGIFYDGRLAHADTLPLGGAHITTDIATGLCTTFAEAERLKTLHGSAVSGPQDERETVDVPLIGEDPPGSNPVPRIELVRIIQPRIEEMIEMARDRLEQSGKVDLAGRRVVLTGGTSQLPGIRDVAQRILDKHVRLGRPLRITRPLYGARTPTQTATGLTEATSGPAFSVAAGLLAFATQPDPLSSSLSVGEVGGAMLSRFGSWIRQTLE